MNECVDSEIQELLPDLLHGSLDEQSRRLVELHLAGCESCREELDVIRTVKAATIFAPGIDVGRVVRQIPPYRGVVPGVQMPARTRMVQWLVAAGLALAVVGGGSLVMSRQPRPQTAAVGAVDRGTVNQTSDISKSVRETVAVAPAASETAPARTHSLALASNLDDLSDGNLMQLMSDMDQFDALPAAEPEPVIAVDSGDSL